HKPESVKNASNLPDYDKARRTFSWKDAEKEVAKLAGHKLNAAYIAIDRHAETFRKNKIALYYEGDKGNKEQYTFTQMSEDSNRFANVLVKHGVNRGDRVFIFLPRIPELYTAFLGILK